MEKIEKLEGHKERVLSSNDGSITWTVRNEDLDQARIDDENLFKSKDFPNLQNITYEERERCDYKTGFWKLCPSTIEEDVEVINKSIRQENIFRKERYKRPIKGINKSEFIVFNSCLIAAAAYNNQG